MAQTRIRTIAAMLAVGAVSACGGGGNDGALSAARDLAGTWKTKLPVKMYFKTDWCTPAPALVASQDWNITWTVTPGADENTVDVQMGFSASNFQAISGCPDTGVVPEVSPLFLTGTVSSSRLTLKMGSEVLGDFTFTNNIMQGDFNYLWCAAFCQVEYTQNRELILTR